MPLMPQAFTYVVPDVFSRLSFTYSYPDTAPNYTTVTDTGLTALTDGKLCTLSGSAPSLFMRCKVDTDDDYGAFGEVQPNAAPPGSWTYEAAYAGAMWQSGTPSIKLDFSSAVKLRKLSIIGFSFASSAVYGPGQVTVRGATLSDLSDAVTLRDMLLGNQGLQDRLWWLDIVLSRDVSMYRYFKLTLTRANTYLDIAEVLAYTA